MHVCILSCICIIVQSLNTLTVKGIKTNIGMKGTPSPQRFTGRDVICHMSSCVCHVKSGLPWIQETRADPIQPADTEPGPTWERGPASGPDEARLCGISATGVDTHRGESGQSCRLNGAISAPVVTSGALTSTGPFPCQVAHRALEETTGCVAGLHTLYMLRNKGTEVGRVTE